MYMYMYECMYVMWYSRGNLMEISWKSRGNLEENYFLKNIQ